MYKKQWNKLSESRITQIVQISRIYESAASMKICDTNNEITIVEGNK